MISTAPFASLTAGGDDAESESCYKFQTPKTIGQWLLFDYVDGEFTPLSAKAASERLLPNLTPSLGD